MYERRVIISSLLATAFALVGVFLFASSDAELRGRVLSILAIPVDSAGDTVGVRLCRATGTLGR
jgi:NADH:ubiquinone oxidoreductase subunit K